MERSSNKIWFGRYSLLAKLAALNYRIELYNGISMCYAVTNKTQTLSVLVLCREALQKRTDPLYCDRLDRAIEVFLYVNILPKTHVLCCRHLSHQESEYELLYHQPAISSRSSC